MTPCGGEKKTKMSNQKMKKEEEVRAAYTIGRSEDLSKEEHMLMQESVHLTKILQDSLVHSKHLAYQRTE